MIIINVDIMLAKKKMSVSELADKIGLTLANVSLLKNGKVKAIRLSTLNKICEVLDCQPSDILEYRKTEEDDMNFEIATDLPKGLFAEPKIKVKSL